MSLSCKDDLDVMIRSGHPLPKVAKWLQEEMGEYTDIGSASLVTTLSRYRQAMPAGDLLESRNILIASNAAKKIEKGIDELDAMESLYARINERIDLGMKLEKGRKKRGSSPAIPAGLNPKMSQEFAVALQILARRHDLKMDLGLQRGSTLPSANISAEDAKKMEEKYGPDVGRALKSPESRAKVLSLVTELRKRTAKKEEEAAAAAEAEAEEARKLDAARKDASEESG